MILLPALVLLVTHTSTTQQTPWVEQTIGDIRVSAPAPLKKFDLSKVKTPANTPPLDLYIAKSEGLAFMVQAMRKKLDAKKTTATALSGFLHGLVTKNDAEIDGERNLLWQGWPGIAVTCDRELSGVTVASRAFVYDDTLVCIGVSYPTDAKRPDAVDKYLNSLHFAKEGLLKTADPSFVRFPLGDSGISALFPSEPQKRDDKTKVKTQEFTTHTYLATYCFRLFMVMYFDVPSNAPEPTSTEISQFYGMLLDPFIEGIEGKKTKERDMGFGEDVGLYREFMCPNNFSGSAAVVRHKKQVAMMVELGPKGYRDPSTIEAFYKSLQFSQ